MLLKKRKEKRRKHLGEWRHSPWNQNQRIRHPICRDWEIETKIVAAGISRFATLCFQWNWYGSIEKWHTQNKSKYFTKCSIKHQEDWYPSPCLLQMCKKDKYEWLTCFLCLCVRTSMCVHYAWYWQSIENLMQKCP